MRVLLVEPYLGGSHRAWAEGYARYSSHDVTVVGHEARFWKWRMQGGFVTLAADARQAVAEHGRPDVILASSMLHVPAFLGAAREVIDGAAVALYMHENQLTYPPIPGTDPDLTYPMINWVSMTAADLVFFNSAYHRAEWFSALPNLLKHFPDYTHTHLVDEVAARSEVLPVGVDLRRLDGPPPARSTPPLVLWNQRWEYDKNPGEFLDALERLATEDVPFRVAIAGESFSTEPGRFEATRERLGERVVHFGYAPEPEYVELLRRADVVASTSHHEFFGIAVVEAIYAGAFPVLPHRLSYPEHLPAEHHEACLYDDGGLLDRLRWALTHPVEAAGIAEAIRPALARYDWSVVAPEYDRRLAAL